MQFIDRSCAALWATTCTGTTPLRMTTTSTRTRKRLAAVWRGTRNSSCHCHRTTDGTSMGATAPPYSRLEISRHDNKTHTRMTVSCSGTRAYLPCGTMNLRNGAAFHAGTMWQWPSCLQCKRRIDHFGFFFSFCTLHFAVGFVAMHARVEIFYVLELARAKIIG